MQVGSAPDGSLVSARVVPRSRPGLEVDRGTLVIRVAARPVGGMANAEACRTLAQALGVPVSSVAVRLGTRSRSKVFQVAGLEPAQAMSRLRAVVG